MTRDDIVSVFNKHGFSRKFQERDWDVMINDFLALQSQPDRGELDRLLAPHYRRGIVMMEEDYEYFKDTIMSWAGGGKRWCEHIQHDELGWFRRYQTSDMAEKIPNSFTCCPICGAKRPE